MRGNNSMNTSSLVCKGAKGFQSKKKWSNFRPKMFGLPLYLRNATPPTPIKCGSNGQAYEMREKRQKKREGKRERERERERTEEKMRDQIAKKKTEKKKKKKKTNKNLHTHTFSHPDPCVTTFRECKILAVLDCEEQHICFCFQVSCV